MHEHLLLELEHEYRRQRRGRRQVLLGHDRPGRPRPDQLLRPRERRPQGRPLLERRLLGCRRRHDGRPDRRRRRPLFLDHDWRRRARSDQLLRRHERRPQGRALHHRRLLGHRRHHAARPDGRRRAVHVGHDRRRRARSDQLLRRHEQRPQGRALLECGLLERDRGDGGRRRRRGFLHITYDRRRRPRPDQLPRLHERRPQGRPLRERVLHLLLPAQVILRFKSVFGVDLKRAFGPRDLPPRCTPRQSRGVHGSTARIASGSGES